MTLGLFIQTLAVVLLLLAGVNCPAPPRLSLGWLGLFFWFLVALLGGALGVGHSLHL